MQVSAAEPAGRSLGGRDAVAVIAWFEWRTLSNYVSNLRQSRGRAAAWLVFLLLVLFGVVTRSVSGKATSSPFTSIVSAVIALSPGGFWLAAGLLARSAVDSVPVTFPRRADARMLPGSRLAPRLVVAWMALRQLLVGLLRTVPAMLWILVASLRGGATDLGFGVVGFLGLVVALHLLRLGAWRVGRRHPAMVKRIAGAVALAGVAVVAASVRDAVVSTDPLAALSTKVVALPPGNWWAGALHGNTTDLTALAGMALVAVAAIAALSGGDMYPEMWAASQLGFRLRELRAGRRTTSISELRSAARQARSESRAALRQQGPGGGDPDAPRRWARGPLGSRQARYEPGPDRRIPSGAWALAWKEWLETTRRIGRLRAAAAVVAAAAAGVVLGVAVRSSARPGGWLSALAGFSVYAMALGNVAAAQRIAADLTRTVWWLSSASLRRRLAVATAASAARQAALVLPLAVIALGVAGYGWDAAGAVPLAAALPWLFRSTSLATISVLPAGADLRGPGMLLRTLAMLVALSTIAICGGLFFALVHNLAGAAAVAAVVAGGEGSAAVAFASRRFDGNGFAIAGASGRAR